MEGEECPASLPPDELLCILCDPTWMPACEKPFQMLQAESVIPCILQCIHWLLH